MVVDTSALAAILFDEPEREVFIGALAEAPRVLVSTGTVLEATMVVESRLGEHGGRELDLFLHRAGAEVVPLDHEHVELAREAWRRFGKGRHPAALNMGDLFSYALARTTGEPLLFKGEDFSRSDIVSAL
ncbi:type II toxin-antitoxin system VapC family toxin [Aquipuribacter nitratireducens]|uniref:Ribonuclease VapC n=1 Tax=Aquipuribacter nitratireducens TaxID=650104 RepID=A0ABW0GKC9_9MICO